MNSTAIRCYPLLLSNCGKILNETSRPGTASCRAGGESDPARAEGLWAWTMGRFAELHQVSFFPNNQNYYSTYGENNWSFWIFGHG